MNSSSNNEINLKTQNARFLWIFISFNIILLVAMFFAENFHSLWYNYQSIINIRLGSIIVAPLIVFILNGLIGSNQKASLVFWRLKNILPGCRAFSQYGPKDNRVDINVLTNKYGDLPTDEREQNILWYKIFKVHSDNIIILKSHKDFLLARDLTSLSFLFFIMFGFPSFLLGTSPYSWIYFSMLIVQYLILMTVARNHGRRFVVNVLALESTI